MNKTIALLLLFAPIFAGAAFVHPVGCAFSRKNPFIGERVSLFIEIAVPVGAELQNVSFGGLSPSIDCGVPSLAERRQAKGGDGAFYEILKISCPVSAREAVTLDGRVLRLGGICVTRELSLFSLADRGRSFNVQMPIPETTFRELPPEGRPDGFGGAIGRFGLSSEIDDRNPETGGVVSIVYTLSGFGERGKSQVSIPEYDKKAFRAYSPEPVAAPKDAIESFSVKLVPVEAGSFDLPQASFSFFDPETECYRTVYSGKAKIDVREKGDCPAPSVRTISLGQNADAERISSSSEGIALYLAPSLSSMKTFVVRQDDVAKVVERTRDGRWEKVESAKTGRRGWREAVR